MAALVFCQCGSDRVDITNWNVNRARLHCFSCGHQSWLDGFTISEFDPSKLFAAALVDQARKHRERPPEKSSKISTTASQPSWRHFMNIARMLTATAALLVGSVPLPAQAQVTAGQQTATEVTQASANLAKDVAELNTMLQQLSVPVIPATATPARSQPNTAAPQIFTVPSGQGVEIIGHQNGWVLGKTVEDKMGWFPEMTFPGLPSFEDLLQALFNRVQQLKIKYESGPIRIQGFSIDMSLPPGLTVNFDFRESTPKQP